MAWYSLYKWFSPWRKKPYNDMIYLYKEYLYNQWFNSLSEEDKQIVLKNKRKQKEKDRQKLKQLMMGLSIVSSSLQSSNRLSEYHKKVYNDVYDNLNVLNGGK